MNYIKKAFSDKVRRNWNTLYVCIDLHDTIIEGKYNLHNVGAQYYPNAINVLRNWSLRKDMCLILWTSSHTGPITEALDRLAEYGVRFDYINANPECPNTDLCDFSEKFYFNIGLDDKFGFDGNTDWIKIEDSLKEIGEWDFPKEK